ncbi:MAG: hypothetical protein QM497_05230 [Sulfurimonas sp.]
MQAKAIKTDTYLDPIEINNHLKKVNYIIMAAPAPEVFKNTPIQFTIFLNTDNDLPQEAQNAVLEKFLKEQKIGKPSELMSRLMPVGFALSTAQDTPMPLLLVDPQDQKSIPYHVMFVMDFLADSDAFSEAKENSLTGWSYSYE